MDGEKEREIITEQLVELNKKMAYQNSMRLTFLKGIIYGVGFFVGSAIIATIAVGVLSPWIGEIDWVRDSFQRGSSFR
jgi:uncharacterized membrane protein